MSASKPRVLPLALAPNLALAPYLPLGMIAAYVRAHDAGRLAELYDVHKVRLGGVPAYSLPAVFETVREGPPPVCLLSSYVWNEATNLRAGNRIKNLRPDALVVIGGPEIPRRGGDTEAFLEKHPFIDVAVLGEGEVTTADMLAALGGVLPFDRSRLADVEGIVYRDGERFVRTAPRPRVKDLNVLPSPYLTGEFGPWFDDWGAGVFETNRGCPYGCTYCDWGAATLQKIAAFDLERLRAEIAYLGERRVQSVFIADANFGVLPQDVEIARAFVETNVRTGFPKRVVSNFAKNGGKYLMQVMKILHDGGLLKAGIVALQTTDPVVLKAIRRDNIKTAAYEKLMAFFTEEGIPMSSDILVGLPGQTVDSLEQDLQFCFDWKVFVNAFNTSVMPNAPMSEPAYLEEHGIVVGPDRMVRASKTFTPADLESMKALVYTYAFHIKYGVTRYYLYFLQNDHGVPALRLLRRWLEAASSGDPALPVSTRVYREVFALENRDRHWYFLTWGDEAKFLFDDPTPLYRELHALAEREFGVSVSATELAAIFAAQRAVTPRLEERYPVEAAVEHDVVGYFQQFQRVTNLRQTDTPLRPLRGFGEGTLRAGTPDTRVESIRFYDVATHGEPGWLLASDVGI